MEGVAEMGEAQGLRETQNTLDLSLRIFGRTRTTLAICWTTGTTTCWTTRSAASTTARPPPSSATCTRSWRRSTALGLRSER